MSRLDLSFFSSITPAENAEGTEEPEEPFALSSLPNANGPMDGLIGELRAYQAELEAQNKVLRYSQAAAESASERFETLFSSVPLALMVLGEHDIVVQANSMAHRSFQPTERDRPLTELLPFVSPEHRARVRQAFALARAQGLI